MTKSCRFCFVIYEVLAWIEKICIAQKRNLKDSETQRKFHLQFIVLPSKWEEIKNNSKANTALSSTWIIWKPQNMTHTIDHHMYDIY